ncbi:restriction endonuclease [Erythrobacteraceae bacterium CFH 75059]|uniref:restriction endonuclease n=1 Tax=Qipengyuania thermophila TaxID=2509361 RepID=UPI001022999A|nr:restriction endonuclease [Qipengyuania thermophila]TCD05364.1 restriction endonuclease [Erythrobacteraceae bacterium CFH 75059]
MPMRPEVPDFQTLMLPLLEEAAGGTTRVRDMVDRLALRFALTQEQQAQRLPSGRQTTFANRVHWAKTYLCKAGLLAPMSRGVFAITREGEAALREAPGRITTASLRRYAAFEAFVTSSTKREADATSPPEAEQELPPNERMLRAREELESALAADLLARLVAAPPAFFEQAVVRLLIAMGYGGSPDEMGEVLGGSGDGGVDGVINQDELGLEQVYVQAKRYAPGTAVGAEAIRGFFGALDQRKARKGLFVTTARFSHQARQTADGLSKRIVLVDGETLGRLMVRHSVGCRVEERIAIKAVDEEFFP